MRFKKTPQLPGARRTKSWEWHAYLLPSRAIYVIKSAKGPNIFLGSVSTKLQCRHSVFLYSQMFVNKKVSVHQATAKDWSKGKHLYFMASSWNLRGKTSICSAICSLYHYFFCCWEKESCMITSTWTFSIWHGIQVISGFELKEKSDIGICGKGHCLHRPCTHRIFSRILSVFSANIPKPFQHCLIIL